MLRWLALAFAFLALSACATLRSASPPPSAADADRQLLVMLRASPQHYRPDRNYSGGYGADVGASVRSIGVRLARRQGLKLLDAWPMPALGVDCLVMQAADAQAARDGSDQLAHDPHVARVQPMHAYHLLGGGDPLLPMQPVAAAWHLQDLHRIATGRGITVAEIDSGVDARHPDLRGRISQSRNFVDAGGAPPEAHGTEVAGIIAAVADNGIGIAGVAPQAKLLALRACWQAQADGAAACNSFTLAKAMQFVLQADPQVLNLSLGGPRDELLERLLDLALAQNITVIGAVDPDPANVFPAQHAGVLAVAEDDEADASVSDLHAPGRDIPTTMPGNAFGFVRGSSFAAAEISGLVALLRQLSPRAGPAQVRAALIAPAAVGLDAMRPMSSVDACAAVARMGAHCACDCAVAQTGEETPRR